MFFLKGKVMDKSIIILKLDDLRDSTLKNFSSVSDFVIDQHLYASFGINGISLEEKDKCHPFVKSIREWNNSGHIEIWHHGWDHSKALDRSWFEYSGRDLDTRNSYKHLLSNYNRQLIDFKKTYDIVLEKCGITMRSFGTPYNQNDEVIKTILDQFPEIKVFLFPRTPLYKQLELSIKAGEGRLNIEDGKPGNVDFNYFINNYENYQKSMDYMVLQAHPGEFNNKSFREFTKICTYLKSGGHTFMTPHQYYLYKTHNIKEDL